MHDNALETVMLRNNFYRDNYRRVVTGLLTLLVINLVLVGVIFWMVTHRPEPKYFATRNDGSIIPLTALTEPNLPKASVLQWANEAAIAAYTFNFVDYRRQFQSTADYFTPDGWQQFLKKLNSSNNLATVRARKLVVTAVATAAPVILQEGVVNQRYTWKIELPILVTYQSPNFTTQQALNIIMVVNRVTTLNNPKGIGISQFVVMEGSSTNSDNNDTGNA